MGKYHIILLIGRSGSGKSTIAKELELYGYKQLPSFTTRPMRINEVDKVDHTFITAEQYLEYKSDNQISASTCFNGHLYGATKNMIYEYDTYVIDKDGLLELQQTMPEMNIISIYIKVPILSLITRMLRRGDSISNVISRLVNDYKMFKGAKKACKYKVRNSNFYKTVDKVLDIIGDEVGYD